MRRLAAHGGAQLLARSAPPPASARAPRPAERLSAALSLEPRRQSSLALGTQPPAGAGLGAGAHALSHTAPAPREPAFSPAANLDFERLLDELAAQQATAVSLTNLWRTGLDPSPEQSLLNAQFLWRELRVRFAQRARQLSRLPSGLSAHAAMQEAIAVYNEVTARLVTCPKPRSSADEETFAAILRETKPSSLLIPHKIGLALGERARTRPLSADEQRAVDKELDAFFLSRIGHRFLIQHYLASRDGGRRGGRPHFSGIISGRCSPVAVIEDAARKATELVRTKCGACPEIEIIGDRSVTFTYLPSHIYFIAAELLKNVRAKAGARTRARAAAAPARPAEPLTPRARPSRPLSASGVWRDRARAPQRGRRAAGRHGAPARARDRRARRGGHCDQG